MQDFTLAAFGEDACGRIYVVQLSGAVSRLIDGAASACPALSPPLLLPPPLPPAPPPPPPSGADADGDGVLADGCPAAAHRTLDGCAASVALTVTSPQRVVRSGRLSVRSVSTNVAGRLTLTGRLRARGRSLGVRLNAARITIARPGGHRTALTMTPATRRIIARRLRAGRTEIDLTATIRGVRRTARVRVRT